MIKNIKIQIKELAKTAVNIAEKTLGSNKGKQKKAMAVSYITEHLPVPKPFRKLISILLSSFIDDAVELAVMYMEVL